MKAEIFGLLREEALAAQQAGEAATMSARDGSGPRREARSRWINLASFAGAAARVGAGHHAAIGDKPLVAPLFLPSPLSVWNTFLTLMQNGYQGKSLWLPPRHQPVPLRRWRSR